MAYLTVGVTDRIAAEYASKVDRVVIAVGYGGSVHLDLPEARMLLADLEVAIKAAEAVTAVQS